MMWEFPTLIPFAVSFTCCKFVFYSRNHGKLWYKSSQSFGCSFSTAPHSLSVILFKVPRDVITSPTHSSLFPSPTLCFSTLPKALCPMLLLTYEPFPLLSSLPEKPLLNHSPIWFLAQGSLPPGILLWLRLPRLDLGLLLVLHVQTAFILVLNSLCYNDWFMHPSLEGGLPEDKDHPMANT